MRRRAEKLYDVWIEIELEARNGYSILILEDEDAIDDSLKEKLESVGFVVTRTIEESYPVWEITW